MARYLAKRILYMLLIVFIVTILDFILIQLPPGDYLTSYIVSLQMDGGEDYDPALADSLRQAYGLDKPMYVQYFRWISGVVQGDFGYSFVWKKPVKDLIAGRVAMTLVVAFSSLLFTYAVAIPIGIYSATHQYSFGDHAFTFLGFLGLATPNFLLALLLMFFFYKFFGLSVGGLFSPEFIEAGWSLGKVFDLLKHLVIPVIVIGTAGTGALIRVMRGSLLDELRKQYVVSARAKGVSEKKLLLKYPVRVAINPIVSTIGWTLPAVISGATITSIVLSLQTTGPLLLNSLLAQDMYLAGTLLLFLAILTVVGTFISDILLAILDPRIRFQ